MSRRILKKMVLLSVVAIGCGSNSGGSGTGGTSGGGHGGTAATGGRTATGGTTATGGGAGGSAGAAGGQAGSAGGAAGGTAGAAGGTAGAAGGAAGGTAGAAGGHAGAAGGTGGGTAGAAGGAAGGTAGAAGGHAGAAGGAAGAAGGAAGSAGGAAGGVAGAAGGNAGAAGGAAGSTGMGGMGGGAAGAGGADAAVLRGEYLVRDVLNCGGCHTPSGGSFLSGVSCTPTTAGDCLSVPNLTNDDTGLKSFTNQQIKDAITKGKDPDVANAYLFNRMPYYQFANLSSDDADAIVAFLRTVTGVASTLHANAGQFATNPTTPQNAPVNPSDLPAAGTAAGASNGKYLATLACVTCHTVDLAAETPTIIDAAKAFEGGRLVSGGTVQTSNLTPDATGIMGWSASDVANTIQTNKDKAGKTLCVMRALPNMTDSDATDIGTYLTGIPPVANSITMLCP